jgi:hypothetical protein
LPGNKPEKYSKFRDQCGAIEQMQTEQMIAWTQARLSGASALTSLKAALRLVDDVNAALAAHEAVVAVARAQRFQ